MGWTYGDYGIHASSGEEVEHVGDALRCHNEEEAAWKIQVDTLTAARDRLAAENAELKRERSYWKQGNIRCAVALAAANATLDRLREVVPKGWHWCADCEKMTPPDDEDPDFCGVCECENYWHRGVHVALQAILYPPETTNDDR